MNSSQHTALGTFVAVDDHGRRLALVKQGRGPVAVVLETGLGADSTEWHAVQQAVAQVAPVYRYDRANRGHSDPAPMPRSIQDAVDDLHHLVRAAVIPTPFVLVGHSLGGLIARLYAAQHAQDVAGLVLVDPMHEDQFERGGPLLPLPEPGEPAALTAFRQFWTVDWRDPAKNAEGVDFVRSQAQAHTIRTLGDLPLLVLAAGAATRALSPDAEALRPFAAARAAGLLEIARQSSRGHLRIVGDSGHFIQRDDPDAVIAAIREMLQRV